MKGPPPGTQGFHVVGDGSPHGLAALCLLTVLLLAGCDTWPRYPRYALTAAPTSTTPIWDGHWIGVLAPQPDSMPVPGPWVFAVPCTLDINSGFVTGRSWEGGFMAASLDSPLARNVDGSDGIHVTLRYSSDPLTFYSLRLYRQTGYGGLANVMHGWGSAGQPFGYLNQHGPVIPASCWFCTDGCSLGVAGPGRMRPGERRLSAESGERSAGSAQR